MVPTSSSPKILLTKMSLSFYTFLFPISFSFLLHHKAYFNWNLFVKVWHTASLYHLVHTAALVAAPITKHPNVVSSHFPIFLLSLPFSPLWKKNAILLLYSHCSVECLWNKNTYLFFDSSSYHFLFCSLEAF